MCWKKIEDNIRGFDETGLISIVKPTERKYIIHLIAEEYPEISRVRIAAMVDRSVKQLPAPIRRDTFIRFMQTSL
jgi:hypothetical protein